MWHREPTESFKALCKWEGVCKTQQKDCYNHNRWIVLTTTFWTEVTVCPVTVWLHIFHIVEIFVICYLRNTNDDADDENDEKGGGGCSGGDTRNKKDENPWAATPLESRNERNRTLRRMPLTTTMYRQLYKEELWLLVFVTTWTNTKTVFPKSVFKEKLTLIKGLTLSAISEYQ